MKKTLKNLVYHAVKRNGVVDYQLLTQACEQGYHISSNIWFTIFSCLPKSLMLNPEAKHHFIQLVKIANINVRQQEDKALRFLVKGGHTAAVALLLEMGANVHAKRQEATHAAITRRDIQTIRVLFQYGACLNGMTRPILESPLWKKEYVEEVKALDERRVLLSRADRLVPTAIEDVAPSGRKARL